MKHHTLLKQFQKMFWICITAGLIASTSAFVTMRWAVDLPPDNYTLLETRWLNWPVQECYSRQNIELLIEGPKQETLRDYEQNTKTYISSIQSKLIWFSR